MTPETKHPVIQTLLGLACLVVISAGIKAAQAIDEDSGERSRLASLAKAKTAKTARLAVNEAVQMFAGIGMTDEFDMGFYLKRARVVQMLFGDRRYHLNRCAKLSGY